MKLFILSYTLILIKKIKGNKETSLVYFYYQSSNINCQKGNSYCEIAQIHYIKPDNQLPSISQNN